MIKRIVAAIIAASCSLAQASDYITIGGFSFHSERRQSNGKDWNEFNPGLGFERDLSERWIFSAGVYRNSFARMTVFAGARWQPLTLGPGKFGVMAALASGYRSPVVGALTADVRFSDRFSATLLGGPNPGGKGGVLGIYARITPGQ